MHRHQFYFNFSERKQINHDMIAKGQGLIVISESHVPEFKRRVVAYYEDREGFLGADAPVPAQKNHPLSFESG